LPPTTRSSSASASIRLVDERTLREIYLPAFERVVKRAKPWTVMCAYNKLNGEYCSEHHALLTSFSKMSGASKALSSPTGARCMTASSRCSGGLDLEMPGPKPRRTQKVIDAVRAGTLDAAVLDEAVRRVLTIAFRAAETPKGAVFDVDATTHWRARSRRRAWCCSRMTASCRCSTRSRVAVIGRAAKHPHFQGGGSSHINPTRVDSPFEELQKAGRQRRRFPIVRATRPATHFQQALIDDAVAAARGAEVALIFVALPSYKESEGYDRADLDLTAQQVALIKAVSAVQPRTVVILHNSSAVAMSEWIDGVAAVLEAWMMGQAGGGAVADILYGVVNPSGKLAETFPLRWKTRRRISTSLARTAPVRYGEGLFIGYRYYDAKHAPVLFPFGYGLSYTTFAYSNAHVSAATFRDVDGVTVSVDMTNTGAVAGKEIVQVYVHDRQCKLVRPEKELKGFAKVELQPGETKTVR
jgi:beta-glucosidase